jgi:hypothetical protein
MIRRFATLNAPVDDVEAVLTDPVRLPEWMPGVLSTQILERRDQGFLVRMVQQNGGWRTSQTLDCRLGPRRLEQRQVAGTLRRWEAVWRFLEPPDGVGTTLALELEYETGLLGLVAPRRFLDRMFNQRFEDIARAAERRVRELRARETLAAPAAGERLLEVFETADGLEIRFAGRKYVLVAEE